MKQQSKIIAALLVLFLVITNLQINAQLRSSNNQADYIIIYHPDFQNELSDFIQWRQSKGLTILPVNVNDVYREFNDTASQQESIREFISYALNNWHDPKPQYLLLVGNTMYIPTYKIESELNQPPLNEDSVSVDEYYVTNKIDADEYIDMCIGRYPARNIDELRNMFNKTIQYEDHFNEIEYKYDFLALADSSDQGYFTTSIEYLMNKKLPKNYIKKRIYFQDTSEYKSTKADLFSAINDGTSIMCFYGHANPYIWIRNGIYYSEDFDTTITSDKPFFFTAGTSTQSFGNPERKSIIEKLITNENGGAVASYAPTGLTLAGLTNRYIEDFYSTLVNNKNLTIGKAILETKRNSSSDAYYIKQFTLLGDPALKFPEKLIAELHDVYKHGMQNEILTYPNPFRNNINVSLTGKGRPEIINICDLSGNIILNKKTEYIENGRTYQFKIDSENLPQGVYYVRIQGSPGVNSIIKVD
ncbi:MAG: T9SS type A sorting domain-containing protein [Ignavibacteriae bacterium]|nr:T9SS type A sorting domain-containing protein [Ignavibacteriota bacterium]